MCYVSSVCVCVCMYYVCMHAYMCVYTYKHTCAQVCVARKTCVYLYSSVHRWSILITVQQDATQSSLFIILQVHSTCYGCQLHSSSGVHKTVTTASGTGHIFCAATSLQRSYVAGRCLHKKIWPVPEAVVTVLCTPDDECSWHPEHVEWTCRIINRLLCVASRWTIINIYLCLYWPGYLR